MTLGTYQSHIPVFAKYCYLVPEGIISGKELSSSQPAIYAKTMAERLRERALYANLNLVECQFTKAIKDDLIEYNKVSIINAKALFQQ